VEIKNHNFLFKKLNNFKNRNTLTINKEGKAMKQLTIHEQDLAIGGNVSGAIGVGIGAAAFGGSSPGCAVLGSLVGSSVTAGMGFTPMGGVAGGFVSAGVTSACNNRPGYYSSGGTAEGKSGDSAGYWPSSGGAGGRRGGGLGAFGGRIHRGNATFSML
jgi:hypothetical protein